MLLFLKLLQTLPSGGGDASAKSSGSVPSSAQEAVFFFKYTGNFTKLNGSSSLFGVDYTYECKLSTEASFSECTCKIPKEAGSSWEQCHQSSGLPPLGRVVFEVRVVVLQVLGDGSRVRSSMSAPSAIFAWEIGEETTNILRRNFPFCSF